MAETFPPDERKAKRAPGANNGRHPVMKQITPLRLIGAGLFLVFAAFLYGVRLAGIPYQDPTPEMSARYDHHARVAGAICQVGLGVILAGALAGVVRFATRRHRSKT